MHAAYEQASRAYSVGEVPVGCVIVYQDMIISTTSNRMLELSNPLAHAEMLALTEAFALLRSSRLPDCDLYVTLEPCPMCAHAISLARIRRLYFGAEDRKSGGVINGPKVFNHPTCHHRPEVLSGIMEETCSNLLKSFFQDLRKYER